MALSPFYRSLFVFCIKRRTLINVLYWDKKSLALWQKRLEKESFKWPLCQPIRQRWRRQQSVFGRL
jgi:transposase